MHKRILLLILIGFSVGPIMAQQSLSRTASTMGSSATGVGKFYYANRNEPPRAIEFKERTVTASSFVTNIHHYLNIPPEFTFIEAESNTDKLGMRHRLLQQYYKGIPLEGMVYRVHEKDSFMTSANGKAVRKINLDTQVTLNEEQAFHMAVKYLQTKDSVYRSGRKLIVSKGFTFTPESFSVAFQFDMDVSLIEQWRVSIDARNGQLLNKVSLVNHCFKEKAPPLPYGTGTGLTKYYGNKTLRVEKYDNGSSRLVGQTEHGGTIGTYSFGNVSLWAWIFDDYDVYNFYSSDNTYHDEIAGSVQWATEQAYEYYFKKHDRNSYDNAGSAIISYVHVDQNWDNAAWSRNKLLFGDGSNNNPLVELDVVSHELTHGVTQYEAALQYAYEPGALNESFSDILAKAVEFDTFGDTATWQMAKHFRDGGLRDFSNPNLKNQPDTYAGDLWYTGYEDSGGVHYNSGVQNFWFYLLCEGGNGVNDHQLSYSVNSIGMEAAANITYRNLTEYLSYFSDYLDSRVGSLLATSDLYGKNSIAYQEVANAWDAVGVIDEPIISGLEVNDITATTVKIKAGIIPRGDTLTYHFEYGPTPALGMSSSKYLHTVEGINAINPIEGIVNGLQSGTKYYLRLVGTNENGSSYAMTEFTTISLAPLVKIKQAVDVTETTAILYGQVNPNSLSTSFYFEYGLTPALGLVTPSYPLPDTTEFQDVSAAVVNLQPRQTYYYRLVAANGFASSVTEMVSFFTALKPVISSFTPVAASIGTEITILGQNFNSMQEKNLVSFGATRGQVLSSSSTEIKVKVPAGASFGPITLLDSESGLTAESVQEFVPMFTGEFKKNNLQLRVGFNQPYIWGTVVQDMDGDNKPDIVAIHYQGFSIFQNVNQGGDITEESFVRSTFNVPDFYSSSGFQVIDIDGNGLKDVVGRFEKGIRIYLNFSVPGYIFFGIPVEVSIDNYMTNITFGDFDQDGRIDFAGTTTINGETTVLRIFRNEKPKGTLSAENFEQRYEKVLPYYSYFLTTGDLNSDGRPDLMTGAFDRNFLSILKNNSQPGIFEFEEMMVDDPTRDRWVRYISHDLNQDSRKDIIAHAPYGEGKVAVMENNGTSSEINFAVPTIMLSGNAQSALQPGDINGDGKVDLIVGLNNRKFIFLENKIEAGEHVSNLSFEKFEEYGMPLVNAGSGTVDTNMSINDLNGDGRPEVINAYSYNFGPHDGYQMEIWQNSPGNCLDPAQITVKTSNNTATIVLPRNTTLDQFEIEYASSFSNYWYEVSSTAFYLSPGYTYQLRARAKCYLGFTDYHYINLTLDCVDLNSFSISNIGVNSVFVNATDFGSFEVQYSPAGTNQWITLSQYVNQISNLLAGTTYDLRFRGRCNSTAEFNYKQFTTLCPKLSTLFITDILYNSATVRWTSYYTGNTILEYSADNINWTLIDETQIMFPLTPGKTYFVRGRMACADLNSDFIYASFGTPCPKVSSLYIDNITPFSARINWVDDSNTDSYILKYSMTPGGSETIVETSATSFNLDGLHPGTQYTVAVAPQCIAPREFTLMTFNTVCYAPFNLSVNAITHTTAELSWEDNFSGLPYSFEYSISGSNVWLATETELTNISLSELRPGTRYEVRVHINCLSKTAPNASLRFQTNLYEETNFAPNPTEGEITIYPSKNLIGNRFSIQDNTGRLLAQGELRDYTIDLSVFSPGLYILKIDGEKPVKIIKH
jgi:Zn-dependent metalloprotease